MELFNILVGNPALVTPNMSQLHASNIPSETGRETKMDNHAYLLTSNYKFCPLTICRWWLNFNVLPVIFRIFYLCHFAYMYLQGEMTQWIRQQMWCWCFWNTCTTMFNFLSIDSITCSSWSHDVDHNRDPYFKPRMNKHIDLICP